MPLRITHVDTKVLVFLVQAMPTSLHTACTIPLNQRTGRQSPAKKIMKLFPATVQRCDIQSAELLLQKGRAFFLVMAKRRLMSNIYRWRFPLSIHCKSSSSTVAFDDQENRRDAERPAAANGKDGVDWQPSPLHASPLRTDSPWKWIGPDYLHSPGQSLITMTCFCPNSDIFAPRRPHTAHLMCDFFSASEQIPLNWSDLRVVIFPHE